MRILLVEDDSIQAQLIEARLTEEFENCSVKRIETESDFRQSFDSIVRDPPDLIVMDVMLRWCNISENMPPQPPECEDFSRAGVRCCKMLRANSKTEKIPVVVLTVLDNNGLGLPKGCSHVPKTSDFAQLISELYQIRQ